MNLALWIVQGLLAAIFTASALMKLTRSKEQMLTSGQAALEPFPLPMIRTVALLELLAVVGLILPWLTGIARVLTPVAAIGLAVIMVGAAVAHWRLREYQQVFTLVLALFLASLFVAVGRFADL